MIKSLFYLFGSFTLIIVSFNALEKPVSNEFDQLREQKTVQKVTQQNFD
jgi:hypothetical protein